MSMRKPGNSSNSKLNKRSTHHQLNNNNNNNNHHHHDFNPLSNSTQSIAGALHSKSVAGPDNLQRDQTGRIAEFFSESDVCPVCKSDRYLNPNLRLLVSRCYHKMCESCIDRIFSLGPEPCPICGQTLRKSNFAPQTFENLSVEKEVVIRRRIAKYFNKRLDDFTDSEAYNNYLEEVEDITFNLINGVDVAETEAKIKRFQIENQELIAQNAVYEARQHELNQRQDEALKKQREERKATLLRLEEETQREEEELKQFTLRGLETSDLSAEELISREKVIINKRLKARTLALDLATQTKSMMPSLNGLIDPNHSNISIEKPNIEKEISQWNDYSNLYDLQHYNNITTTNNNNNNINNSDFKTMVYKDEESIKFIKDNNNLAIIGGFNLDEVWERQIRSSVMGLFLSPISPEIINHHLTNDVRYGFPNLSSSSSSSS